MTAHFGSILWAGLAALGDDALTQRLCGLFQRYIQPHATTLQQPADMGDAVKAGQRVERVRDMLQDEADYQEMVRITRPAIDVLTSMVGEGGVFGCACECCSHGLCACLT